MISNIKESIFYFFINNPNKNISKTKLSYELKIQPYEKRLFNISVSELLNNGVLFKTKKMKLMLNRKFTFISGTIYTNSKGFGFLVSANDAIKDLFIPSEKVHNALHEDRVIARVTKFAQQDKRAEGEVVSIISRKLDVVIGTYMANENFGFVVPDNSKIKKDIYIPFANSKNAQSYDKVVCRINKYPEKNRNPEGEIVEIIGVKWDKGVDVLSVLKEYGIEAEFDTKVLKCAGQLSESISEEEYKKRIDLRGKINIFTIDGEDAKDLDDAVSIELLSNGNYKLGVHIADVAHYVKQGSKIDEEAFKRGTSIYLIDTVVSMLPKQLSNNLCSLQPNTDKLTLSVFMEIDNNGAVINHSINESIISSVAKLNYTEVSNYLENNDNAFIDKYPELINDLKEMEKLALLLAKKRELRGAIEFNSPEAKITLDENGKAIDVEVCERRIANDIIEEFMLVCNETVAEEFYWNKLPFIYRVHEPPREEKLTEYCSFIKNCGYTFNEDFEQICSMDFQNLLNKVKGKKEERAINILLLQSMQQARYYSASKGHFGLSTKFYCHFTSPIRRYPDLQIHRIIKDKINNRLNLITAKEYEKRVEDVSKNSSRRERIAEQAEKELYLIKKLEFMEDKIGQVYEGIVTSLTSKGMKITLNNTVEGFLKADRLTDDIYEHIKEQCAFIGQATNKKITVGDSLLVSVSKVDLNRKELLFDLILK